MLTLIFKKLLYKINLLYNKLLYKIESNNYNIIKILFFFN